MTEERRKDWFNVDSLKEDISNLRTDIALLAKTSESNHKSLRDFIDRISELTENHNKIIHGNGSPGISSEIRNTNTILKAFKESFSVHERWDFVLFCALFGFCSSIAIKLFFFNG